MGENAPTKVRASFSVILSKSPSLDEVVSKGVFDVVEFKSVVIIELESFLELWIHFYQIEQI